MQLIAFLFPVFICWTYERIQNRLIEPQAILVLGGSTRHLEREKFAAKFALKHKNLPIWITGGSPPKLTQEVFARSGVSLKLLHLDYEAVDTLTNFTTLVDELQSQGIKSIYLITSDFHMRRASVVGKIILGSRGIRFQAVTVHSDKSPEPISKSVRDGVRAIIWITTGYTGEEGAGGQGSDLRKGAGGKDDFNFYQ